MKKHHKFFILPLIALLVFGCGKKEKDEQVTEQRGEQPLAEQGEFKYKVDQFANLQILRYRVPGFEDLSLQQKKLAYYLSQAGLSGRDIIYDQNYRNNLTVRRMIEQIVIHFQGDRESDEFKNFMVFAKEVWFSNGIHHHYSTKKLVPDFSPGYLKNLLENSSEAVFPFNQGERLEDFEERMRPIIFDANVDAKRVNLAGNVDNVKESANNFYRNVSKQEVENFYKKIIDKNDPEPPLYGLNSQLTKENGKLVEKTWKVGGMYSAAIEKIVYWLEKAASVAENVQQKDALEKLTKYYKTGDLKDFDAYNIAWVKDTASVIDITNGFIEVYGDAMGYRGSYESVLSFKDPVASKRMAMLAHDAQWFEDNSPIMDEHKKKEVTGVTYKVITVINEAGDAAPSTPIGINLPNSSWIRKNYGSKSVSLGNILEAYEQASGPGVIDEFGYSQEEKDRVKKYGVLSGDLHTAMHEVIGHASGQLEPGVGTTAETLKNYASALEEGRADLVALYYLMDPKLMELGVMPSLEVGKTEYDSYIRNGLMLQLRRLKEGENIEEAHMRNRQMVAAWVFEKGKKDNVIERVEKDGKTFFVINDYQKLRVLFGELLREVQRVISQGDFKAGKALIENYGVIADQDLMKEVKERYQHLHTAPYSGFIQPKLIPVMENEEIVDVKVEYPMDFVEQMLDYGKDYSFLPNQN
ncbi:dipeptidyl-peptidase 3 family protein [Xanthovirga aplysinae]|uniref:dipeptidyl-peptidase 3 family protein n=1 Tax=Xanthovirga aplysinae TaxID=2529853 RepID=UPI0012BC90D8|nr:dihydrofolate reductase [Xanthovirga aplysinae]MTI30845.1 dihydrofolate reductase [Xanthovirga aplysinae]